MFEKKHTVHVLDIFSIHFESFYFTINTVKHGKTWAVMRLRSLWLKHTVFVPSCPVWFLFFPFLFFFFFLKLVPACTALRFQSDISLVTRLLPLTVTLTETEQSKGKDGLETVECWVTTMTQHNLQLNLISRYFCTRLTNCVVLHTTK